jgi:hypothetical protein
MTPLRKLLLIVFAAVLLAGAFAQITPTRGRSRKCPRTLKNVCSKCNSDGECTRCKDPAAEPTIDGDGCECKEDYGTVTRSQYNSWGTAGRKSRKPRYPGAKKCLLCERYGLVAVDGVCEEDVTVVAGRRLFATNEDIWV